MEHVGPIPEKHKGDHAVFSACGGRPCVLVPAYQAARSLGPVLDALQSALADVLPSPPSPPSHVAHVAHVAGGDRRGALLVIDDGSTDATAEVARAHGADVVRHERNRGKGAALLTGLGEARARGFDVALTVDADGQHPAGSAREVLFASPDGGALVLGVRNLAREGAPRKNQLSNGISNFFLSRFAGAHLADTQCGLRRYPVDATLALGAHARGYAFEAEVLLLAARRGVPIVQREVHVVYPPERERTTHFDGVRDPMRIIAVVLRTLYRSRRRA